MPKVLIATTGSLGDLNPMLAVGERLRSRGAEVSIATHPGYQSACCESNLRFLPLGTADERERTLSYSRRLLDEQSLDVFVERGAFDQLDLTYEQLLEAARDADVLVAPSHVVAAHLVAEKLGIPYVACALCLLHIRPVAPLGSEEHRRISTSSTRWHTRLKDFRQTHGLRRRVFPFASLLADARKVLGMLPSFLLSASELRNPHLHWVGHAEHRQPGWMSPDAELREFCDDRTVAFAFGSHADACDPVFFFDESVSACRSLRLKCVYLTQQTKVSMLERVSDDVLVRHNLAPAAVFPLVGLAVHHGGAGTLMAACKSLRPMAIVPFFLDQPLQAARMAELIGSPNVSARNYSRETAIEALRHALRAREEMSLRLRDLMAGESDGADRGAQSILSILEA